MVIIFMKPKLESIPYHLKTKENDSYRLLMVELLNIILLVKNIVEVFGGQ
jgi:hypothetical protein